MARYAVPGQQAVTAATFKTAVSVSAGGTARRGKIFDLVIGTSGTPADNVITWDLSRQTVNGTATAVTPQAMDAADSAALLTAQNNHTAEPTVAANSSVFNLPVNQRTAYRWMAVPGAELVYPATGQSGFALRVLSPAYTGGCVATKYVEEQ